MRKIRFFYGSDKEIVDQEHIISSNGDEELVSSNQLEWTCRKRRTFKEGTEYCAEKRIARMFAVIIGITVRFVVLK